MQRRHKLLLATLTVVLAVATTALPGLAAKPGAEIKTYTASFSAPNDGWLNLTLANQSTNQQLGSANIYVPAGVTVTGTNPPATFVGGSVTFNNVTYIGTLQLRNLAIPPSSTATYQNLVRVSGNCLGGTVTWGIQAKQANNFSGSPGNDFTLVGASLTTTFPAGSCALRWKTQPQDEVVDATITGVDFGSQVQPPSGTRPQVELYDPATGSVINSFTGQVFVEKGGSGTGTLSGTLVRDAAGGVATFDDLEIDRAGTYTLVASSSAASSSVTSDAFQIAENAEVCSEDRDCSLSFDDGKSSVKITAVFSSASNEDDAGFLTAAFSSGGLDCDYPDGTPYAEYSGFTAEFFYNLNTRSFTVVGTVSKQVMNADPRNGVAFLEFCLAALEPFKQKDLTPAPLQGDEYVGLLPDCGVVDPARLPCVVSRNRTKAGQGVITVTIPGVFHGGEDPKGRF